MAYSAAARRGGDKPRGGARAAGGGESVEQLHRHRILERPVLGVPLQRQREGRRIGNAESLDLAVLGDGFETRARRQAIDALGVQRIHLYAALAQQAMQHAAVDDLDVVRRRVVDVDVR